MWRRITYFKKTSLSAVVKNITSTKSPCQMRQYRATSLIEYGEQILRESDPSTKVALTFECHDKWMKNSQSFPIFTTPEWEANPPASPSRPKCPPLYDAQDMPKLVKRSDQTNEQFLTISILHALAHIELGAIDNYWDTLVRFSPEQHDLDRQFYCDFLNVACDEARHFDMVNKQLFELDSSYGELPSHLSLLQHAENTADDLAARIAIIPLVQEARGLDSGPKLVERILNAGDKESANIVKQIVYEERNHVACGVKWFKHICKTNNIEDPVKYFHTLVLKHFPNGLPGPFNVEARLASQMDTSWYMPLEMKKKKQTQPTERKKVAIVGTVWPERQSSAAGVRSSALIQLFKCEGYEVMSISPSKKNNHTMELEEQGVPCFQCDPNSDEFITVLKDFSPQVVIMDRFLAEEMYGWQVEQHLPKALRVLDLQDLHFLRKGREHLVKRKNIPFKDTLNLDVDLEFVQNQVIRELASIHRSDLTLYVSDFEKKLLVERFQILQNNLFQSSFYYNSHEKPSSLPSFEERTNIVVIGSFKHSPNVDAVEWLKRELWPSIRKLIKDDNTELHIYGSYASERVLKLSDPSSKFIIKGFAEEAHDVLKKYRLSLSPLRFGAGIKGKIADSWYCGTPCVSTSVGAEGMFYSLLHPSGWGGSIANDATMFAEEVVSLYTSKQRWEVAQTAGFEIVETAYNIDLNGKALISQVEDALETVQINRKNNWMGRILWSEKFRATEYMSKYIHEKQKYSRVSDFTKKS